MLGASKITSQRQYILLNEESFNTNGNHNYTIPKGVVYIEIECWGGGGGGAARTFTGSGRTAVYWSGAGGGGGGYAKKTYYGGTQGVMQQGDFITLFVGAGGFHQNTEQKDGKPGQNSSAITHQKGTGRDAIIFTDFEVVGYNGRGGQGGTGGGAGGVGGTGSGGDQTTSGENGESVPMAGPVNDGGTGGDAGNGGEGGIGGGYDYALGGWFSAVAGVDPGGGGGGSPKGSFSIGATGGHGRVTIKAYG